MTTRTSFKPQNAAYMLLRSWRCCSMLSAVLAPVEPAMGASPLAAAVPDASPPPAPATAAAISPAAIIPPPTLRPGPGCRWSTPPQNLQGSRKRIARRQNVRALATVNGSKRHSPILAMHADRWVAGSSPSSRRRPCPNTAHTTTLRSPTRWVLVRTHAPFPSFSA